MPTGEPSPVPNTGKMQSSNEKELINMNNDSSGRETKIIVPHIAKKHDRDTTVPYYKNGDDIIPSSNSCNHYNPTDPFRDAHREAQSRLTGSGSIGMDDDNEDGDYYDVPTYTLAGPGSIRHFGSQCGLGRSNRSIGISSKDRDTLSGTDDLESKFTKLVMNIDKKMKKRHTKKTSMGEDEFLDCTRVQFEEDCSDDISESEIAQFLPICGMGPQHILRRTAMRICLNKRFENAIVLLVCINTLFLMLEDHRDESRNWWGSLANDSDLIFTFVYTIEACLKILARGFWSDKRAYLKDIYNRLDFIVVVTSWVGYAATDSPSLGSLRVFRVLRPLRALTFWPGIRQIIDAFNRATARLTTVLVMMAFLVILAGLLGSVFFKVTFHQQCRYTKIPLSFIPLEKAENEVYFAQTEEELICKGWCVFPLDTGLKVFWNNIPVPLEDQIAVYNEFCDERCRLGVESHNDKFMSYIWPVDTITSPTKLCGGRGKCGQNPHPILKKYISTTTCGVDRAPKSPFGFVPPEQEQQGSRVREEFPIPTETRRELFYGLLNFDHIGMSAVVVIIGMLLERWTSIMYVIQDGSANIYIPFFFFSILVVVGAFFLVNMTLAVVWDTFVQKQEFNKTFRRLLYVHDKTALDWITTNIRNNRSAAGVTKTVLGNFEFMGTLVPKGAHLETKIVSADAFPMVLSFYITDEEVPEQKLDFSLPKLPHPMRLRVRWFTSSSRFQLFICFAICANVVLMMYDNYPPNLIMLPISEILNTVFIWLFFFELLLTNVDVGPFKFWTTPLYQIDGVIVLVSMIELFATGNAAASSLRVLRLLRLIKLGKSWRSFRILLKSIWATMLSIVNFLAVMLFVILVFALMGEALFANSFKFDEDGRHVPKEEWDQVCTGPPEDKYQSCIPRANFDDFGSAFVTCFQILTSEDWPNIMFSGIRSTSWAAAIYFIFQVICGVFLVLNMFLAILMSNFDNENKKVVNQEAHRFRDLGVGDSIMIAEFARKHKDVQHLVIPWKQSGNGGLQQIKEDDDDDNTFSPNSIIAKIQKIFTNIQSYIIENIIKRNQNSWDPWPLFIIPRRISFIMYQVVTNTWFELTVQIMIFTSTVAMAFTNPLNDPSGSQVILEQINIVVTIFFIAEQFFKTCTHGFLFGDSHLRIIYSKEKTNRKPKQDILIKGGTGSNIYVTRVRGYARRKGISTGYRLLAVNEDFESFQRKNKREVFDTSLPCVLLFEDPKRLPYLRSPWNVLDFAIVIVSVIDIYFTSSFFQSDDEEGSTSNYGSSNFGSIQSFRMLRCLRVLRLISWFPNLKMVVETLLNSLAQMVHILTVLFFVLAVFGLFCRNIYKGRFFRCYKPAENKDVRMNGILQEPEEWIDDGVIPTLCRAPGNRPFYKLEDDEECPDGDEIYKRPYHSWPMCLQVPPPIDPNIDWLEYLKKGQLGFAIQPCSVCQEEMCPGPHSEDLKEQCKMVCALDPWHCQRDINKPSEDKDPDCMEECVAYCLCEESCERYAYDAALCVENGAHWIQEFLSFDDSLRAIQSLFEISTTEGWTTVYYNAVDAPDYPMHKLQRDQDKYIAAIIFLSFMILVSFFVLNLTVGVIIDNFNKIKTNNGLIFVTSSQRQWIESQKSVYRRAVFFSLTNLSQLSPDRRKWYKIIMSNLFDTVIVTCIVLNAIFFASQVYPSPSQALSDLLEIVNMIFAIIFNCEALLKLYVLRWSYFQDPWNKFDFSCCIVSSVGEGFDLLVRNMDETDLLSAARLFRVIRIVRLIRFASGLSALFDTFLMCLPKLFNVGSILALLLFLFSVMGIQLFAKVRPAGEVGESANFTSLIDSIIILVRCITGEDWHQIMHFLLLSNHDYMKRYNVNCVDLMVLNPQNYAEVKERGLDLYPVECGSPIATVLFFYVFTLLLSFVVLNLFIAVIFDAFEDSQYIKMRQLVDRAVKLWSTYDEDHELFVPLKTSLRFIHELCVDFIDGLRHENDHNASDIKHQIKEMRSILSFLDSTHAGESKHLKRDSRGRFKKKHNTQAGNRTLRLSIVDNQIQENEDVNKPMTQEQIRDFPLNQAIALDLPLTEFNEVYFPYALLGALRMIVTRAGSSEVIKDIDLLDMNLVCPELLKWRDTSEMRWHERGNYVCYWTFAEVVAVSKIQHFLRTSKMLHICRTAHINPIVVEPKKDSDEIDSDLKSECNNNDNYQEDEVRPLRTQSRTQSSVKNLFKNLTGGNKNDDVKRSTLLTVTGTAVGALKKLSLAGGGKKKDDYASSVAGKRGSGGGAGFQIKKGKI